MINLRSVRRGQALSTAGAEKTQNNSPRLLWALLLLLVLTAWSYWPTMVSLFKEWQGDDNYSAGQLVPLVAIFMAWRERKRVGEYVLAPCWWGGVLTLLLAQAARTYGLLFMFESAERYSLVLTVAGLVLMVAGWRVFRRVSWILLFLLLMVPLPGRVHNLIGGPLQRMATTGSVFLLEAFGVRVSQQGNVMMLNQNTPLAVAEACSGLRMLTAFIIVAGFIAYMVKRPPWQKAVVFASCIPVAVVCNIVRIFATALIMLWLSAEAAEKFFHDFAGFVMMPVAVFLMFGELWLMEKLIVSEPQGPSRKTVVSARSGPGGHPKEPQKPGPGPIILSDE
jgi:exosortase